MIFNFKLNQKSLSRLLTSTIISVTLVLIYLLVFRNNDMDYTAIYNTYNPATFRNTFGGTSDDSDNQFKFVPIENLFHDEELQKRLNNDMNNFCPVFTFFNDEKIRKLSIEEQNFHKTMLKKWIMLYDSLGFKVNILHYNDAVSNPKMDEFVNKRILFNKNNQINENYMKLLAWENKSLQMDPESGISGFYSDYTIFPMVGHSSVLSDLRLTCKDFQGFTLFEDYDFQLITSDSSSISKILDSLISKNRDFEILETDKFNSIFADYSLKTFAKLLNNKNIKTLVEKIPKILDQHLRAYRLTNRFSKINIVDPLALSDHYFFRPIFSILRTLTKCEEFIITPPTKHFLKNFEKNLKERLPDPITPDSDLEYVTRMDKLLEELYSSSKTATRNMCSNDLEVEITNELNFDSKALNLISIPHPISVLSALKYNQKNVFISEEIVSIEQNNFLTTLLSKNFKNIEDLYNIIKNIDLNYYFFNFETMTPDSLRHELSIILGFELDKITDSSPVRYNDASKFLNEIVDENMILSQGELMRKLDNVKQLVSKYGEPMSYVINQRQSNSKIQELRDRLKNWNQLEKPTDPAKILETQHFESRHDPIVEISENYNKLDSSIWHLVKNVRFIDDMKFKELTNIGITKFNNL